MSDQQTAATYPPHSCYEWNRQHYTTSREYTASFCGTCGRITGFRWRKWWRRFASLVSDKPFADRREAIILAKYREL